MNLQEEHRAWLDRVYPNQPPRVPAAGCVEEAGELLHAALKLEQENIWGADPRYPDLRSDLEDAVGDCAIYACSLCNSLDWDFAAAMSVAPDTTHRTLLERATRMVLMGLCLAQVPYKKAALNDYIATLKGVCEIADIDAAACTAEVWRRVRARSPHG